MTPRLSCTRAASSSAAPHLGHAACGASAAHEADGRVSCLDLSGDVERLDLGREVGAGLEGGVGLEDHDVAGTGHVALRGIRGGGGTRRLRARKARGPRKYIEGWGHPAPLSRNNRA